MRGSLSCRVRIASSRAARRELGPDARCCSHSCSERTDSPRRAAASDWLRPAAVRIVRRSVMAASQRAPHAFGVVLVDFEAASVIFGKSFRQPDGAVVDHVAAQVQVCEADAKLVVCGLASIGRDALDADAQGGDGGGVGHGAPRSIRRRWRGAQHLVALLRGG